MLGMLSRHGDIAPSPGVTADQAVSSQAVEPEEQRKGGLLRLVAGMNRLQLRPFDRWARQMPQDGATALEPIALQHVRSRKIF